MGSNHERIALRKKAKPSTSKKTSTVCLKKSRIKSASMIKNSTPFGNDYKLPQPTSCGNPSEKRD
jgi:hypothetical protein